MAEIAAIVGSFLGPAIKVVKWVAAPIVRQFNYLCCFTDNITSLEREAEKLDNATRGLQEQVDRETENVRVIVPEVESWLKYSNDIKNQKETILREVSNVESGCLKLGARFSLSKEAKKTTDRMKKLRGEKNFDAISQPGPPAATQPIPLGKTYEFESRKEIEEDIMTTLRGGDVNVMGIYGMGGLGKTTMAQKIRNRVLKDRLFEEAAMAVVSQQVDESKLHAIQLEIGGQLGLKLEEETSRDARRLKLHARLTGKKRTLLVLDDVWEGMELEGLGIPRDSKGCTILFTSRNSDALRKMKVQKVFGMEVLSEEEAWLLFRERAGTCVDDSKLISIAKEVVKECCGLPLALLTVGAALEDDKDVSIWKDALLQLQRSIQDIPNVASVYNHLKLSYDFLSSKQAKSVFLLCCLFAEDAHIPLEQLTYFCVGLGIFENTLDWEGARNRMRRLAKTLKSCSLLLDGNNEDYVRMHDVVRDVCIFIAKQEAYIGVSDRSWFSSFQLLGGRTAVICNATDQRFEFDDAFFEGVRDLSVLCIENYSSTSLPSHESLKNINTLVLDSCRRLKTISVVGELVNLEFLICRYCILIEVLPPEIKGLNRLKLLELTGCWRLQSIGRGIISSLVGLEELKMLRSFNKWEAEDRGERVNAGLRELEALTNLTCLQIKIEDPTLAAEDMRLSSKMERFDIRIGKVEYDFRSLLYYKKLSLQFEGETRLGHWIEMQLLRDSECLSLSGNGAHNVELAKSEKLRWLSLGECETMKNVVRTSTHQVFPCIEYLELRYLPQLEGICDGPISSTSFQNLTSIKISNCPRLRNLGQLSIHAGEDCLSQLQELCIENCEMMEEVFLWNTNNSHITPVFPKLETIMLIRLPRLTTFYRGIQDIEFPLLTSITISFCHRLRNLESMLSIHAGEDCLSQLQELCIENCEKMEEVFLWNTNNSHITQVFPKLKKIELKGLPNLTTFYQGIQGIEFPLLTSIRISYCPRLRNLESMLSIHAGEDCLSQLQELCIENCEKMEEVFLWNTNNSHITQVFPKLKKIELKWLPNLTTFYQGIQGIEFPLLTSIRISNCHHLRNLESMLSIHTGEDCLSQLQELCIEWCVMMEEVFLWNTNNSRITQVFPKLKKIELCWLQNLTTFYQGIQGIEFPLLTSIRISFCPRLRNLGQLSIHAGENCLSHLEELHINCCEMMEQVFLWNTNNSHITQVSPKLKKTALGRLTTISIGLCPKWTSIVSTDHHLIGSSSNADTDDSLHLFCQSHNVSFGNLKKVTIDRFPFCRHKIPLSSFNGLEKLTIAGISGYDGSMSLFTSSIANNLFSLRELSILGCDEMVQVINDDEEEEKENMVSGGKRTVVVFPKLEELELRRLPKLATFCKWKSCDVELPSLRKVDIRECPDMKNWSLGLLAAPNLEAFTTDLNNCLDVVGVNVSFDNLKDLSIERTENPFYHQKIFTSLVSGLEKLEISEFQGSMNSFPFSMAANLVSLRKLSIRNCGEMIKVFEDEEEKVESGGERTLLLFPKLVELHLTSLRKLVSFCEWKCHVEMPSLEIVEIKSCPNMEHFSLGPLTTPNLKIMKIDFKDLDAGKDLNGALQQHLARIKCRQEEKKRRKRKVMK